VRGVLVQRLAFLLLLLLGSAGLAACSYDGGPGGGSSATTTVAPLSADLAWVAADGPVTGYRVFESRDAGPFVASADVPGPSVTVTGEAGETLRIQVAAFDAMGNLGPVSEPSDLLQFDAEGISVVSDSASASSASAAIGSGGSSTSGSGGALGSGGEATRQVSQATSADSADTPESSATKADEAVAGVRLDVDGDGASDLLWESDGEGLLRLTRSDLAVLAVFERPAPEWALVGLDDFDGDGLTDLLWAMDSGELGLSRMAPSLAAQPTLDFAAAGVLAAGEMVVASGDFDGDGAAELLVQGGDAALSVWSLGSGVAPEVHPLALAPAPGPLVVGSSDYDGNGVEDVLFQALDGSLTVWLLDAAGTPSVAPLAAAAGGDVLASGDFDGDGVTDVARRAAADGVELLLLGGGPEAPVGVDWLPAGSAPDVVVAGDYDGDGLADLLAQDAAGSLVVWFTDGAQAVEAVTLDPDPAWVLVPDWR
jgi:hypothetical protein